MTIRLFIRISSNSAHATIELPLWEYSWNFVFEYIFFKSVMKIQVLLKFDNNYG